MGSLLLPDSGQVGGGRVGGGGGRRHQRVNTTVPSPLRPPGHGHLPRTRVSLGVRFGVSNGRRVPAGPFLNVICVVSFSPVFCFLPRRDQLPLSLFVAVWRPGVFLFFPGRRRRGVGLLKGEALRRVRKDSLFISVCLFLYGSLFTGLTALSFLRTPFHYSKWLL